MSKTLKAYQEPTHAEIMERAQRLYESQGRPEGKALEHWLRAENELIAESKAQAGLLPANPPRANLQPARRQPVNHN